MLRLADQRKKHEQSGRERERRSGLASRVVDLFLRHHVRDIRGRGLQLLYAAGAATGPAGDGAGAFCLATKSRYQ